MEVNINKRILLETFQQHIKQTIERLNELIAIDPEHARDDFRLFCEAVLRDRNNQRLKLRPYQREWIDHILYCLKNGYHIGLIAPFGTGKSTIISIALPLWLIGRNPLKIAGAIVGLNEDNASNRVAKIKEFIESSPDYQQIFPKIQPSKSVWSQKKIKVDYQNRINPNIDPTLVAAGIMSGAISKRLTLVIYDDVYGQREILSESEMRRREDMLLSGWASRLPEGALQAYVGNIWYENDISSRLLKDSLSGQNKYAFMHMYLDREDHHIILKSPVGGKHLDLDEETKKEIQNLKKNVREDIFMTNVYAVSEQPEQLLFSSFPKVVDYQTGLDDLLPGRVDADGYFYPDKQECKRLGWQFAAGVDLSTRQRAGNVIIVGGIYKNRKYVVDIYKGNWTSPELAHMMNAVFQKWNIQVFAVEANAYQISLIEWIQETSPQFRFFDRIVPVFTTRQKNDPLLGLPLLEVQFSNRSWLVPAKHIAKHSDFCKCEWCEFVNAVRSASRKAPTTHDMVMALYFLMEAFDVLGPIML